MNKNVKIGLIVVAVAVLGYLAYQYFSRNKATVSASIGGGQVGVGASLTPTTSTAE